MICPQKSYWMKNKKISLMFVDFEESQIIPNVHRLLRNPIICQEEASEFGTSYIRLEEKPEEELIMYPRRTKLRSTISTTFDKSFPIFGDGH